MPLVEGLVVGDPLDEKHRRVGADLDRRARPRRSRGSTKRSRAGAEILAGGKVREDGVLVPTVLGDVTPDMKVCADEVFGPVVGVATYTRPRRGAARSPTTPATGSRPRSSPPTSTTRCSAARTLDYGGVLVNEVPTFRADQQPYGGVRDSGNTREGPQWAVREMTEERLVIIQL